MKARDSGKTNNFGFLRVAVAVPPVRVADPRYNAALILVFLKRAEEKQVSLAVFPEMSIPGYSTADLYFQEKLLQETQEALRFILTRSAKMRLAFIVGLPIVNEGKLFNVAVLAYRGKVLGIVPKTYIPGYKEFYEERWFSSGRDLVAKELNIFGKSVPIGTDLLFRFPKIPRAVLGIEICEDLWAPLPPSSFQALRGANIIANPSASNELVGKAEYRRNLISQQSARLMAAYLYASSGTQESTTDLVFGGHALIAENGNILAESERFKNEGELVISETDLSHLEHDRIRTTSFGEAIHESFQKEFRFVEVPLGPPYPENLARFVDPAPFVPHDPAMRDLRAKEIFSIQVAALAKRLRHTGIKKIIVGLSGGLDSALAFLVSVKTADLLELPRKNILVFSLPGFGTSNRTKQNACRLALSLGVSFAEMDIKASIKGQFKDLRHDGRTEDLVFENAQARYRTAFLMNKANQIGGLVVGTGDLSEIALGWNTYTGDHIAHYNVNCSVPKTLVRYLVSWVAETQVDKKTAKILGDILATPVSPELRRPRNGIISHKTEKLIGPYELHDFFLYHFIRWGTSPQKIFFLAKIAWGKKYSGPELKKWLIVFLTRFFGSQWKRSVATDGPKIGSVSLSPRGDWRMPSDADASIWLAEAKAIKV